MSFLPDRLKERKLVQWALAYLAGAFFVYNALDPARETWGIPVGVVKAIHILLIVGFFITLILAWYHGEKGRQRVSGLELLMVALLLGIAGVAVSYLASGGGVQEPDIPVGQRGEDERPSVLVLVCENISPDPNDAFFSDGLHGEIINRLALISGLASRGRETARWYRDNPSVPTEIAAREGLDFVGECGVRKDSTAGRLVVTFLLLEDGGAPVWSERYDEDLTTASAFEIQGDIAQQIADRIGVTLTPEESGRVRAPRSTENLTAYELYFRGRNRWMMRQEGMRPVLQEAIGFFEAAIAEDPSFAPAHAALAQAHMVSPGYSVVDVHEAFGAARRAATEALALEPDLPEAHAALGYIALRYDWDWSEAERRLLRAIELNPGDAETRAWYSGLLQVLRRGDEAHQQAELALDRDPLSWSATLALIESPGEAGPGEGIHAGQRYLSYFPESLGAHLNLSLLLFEQSSFEEAGEEFVLYAAPLREILPPDSLRAFYQAMGDPETWDHAGDLLQFIEERVWPGSVLYYGLARFHARLGNSEKALDLAGRMIADRSWLATQLGSPWWASLYDDPRYLALLDEVGLPHPAGER